MSFVNDPLHQNVAAGLGGQADAQLAREAMRNQVQPSKDIMVSRTSGGTFLSLRVNKSGGGTTTTGGGGTTTLIETGGVAFGTASGSLLKYVYDDNDDKVYIGGEATVYKGQGGSSNVGWISPPIAASLSDVSELTTQNGDIFGGTSRQFNFGLWPTPLGGFGAITNKWNLTTDYDVSANDLWLMKLEVPIRITVNTHLPSSGSAYGSEIFHANYIDTNPTNRQWVWTP